MSHTIGFRTTNREVDHSDITCIQIVQKGHYNRCGSYEALTYTEYFFVLTAITKYGSTLYIGMDEVFQHHAHTFEKSDLNFHFQCEFSSVVAEW